MSHVIRPYTFFNILLLWKFLGVFTEYALVVPQIEAFVTLIYKYVTFDVIQSFNRKFSQNSHFIGQKGHFWGHNHNKVMWYIILKLMIHWFQ